MAFSVVDVSDSPVRLPVKKAELNKLMAAVLKKLQKRPEYRAVTEILGRKPASLGLRLCLDPEMRVLNHRYRKLDRSTDVLSFPTIELGLPAAESLDGYLGDLVMSEDALKRGALRMKHGLKEEFTEVLIHGVLHLFGFDHLRGKQRAREMFELQRQLFSHARSVINLDHGKSHRPRRSPAAKPERTRRKT